MVGGKKVFFLAQTVERWKTPSSKRNISEHDIIQYTQITTWLKCGIEINRQIDFG